MLPYLTVCYFLNSIEHEHEQYALIPSHKNQLLKWKSSQSYDPNDCFQVESLKVKVWNLKLRIFSSKSEAPLRLSRKIHYRLFQLQESQQVTRSPRLPFCVFVTRDWVQVLPARARALDVNNNPSIQSNFPEISVQNSMDRFGPTGKVSKKRVHLLRWSSFPRRTGWNFGWIDRAQYFYSNFCLSYILIAINLFITAFSYIKDTVFFVTTKDGSSIFLSLSVYADHHGDRVSNISSLFTNQIDFPTSSINGESTALSKEKWRQPYAPAKFGVGAGRGGGGLGSEGANKVYCGKCAMSSEFFSQIIVSPCVGKFQKSVWNNISPIGQTHFQFVKNNMENSGIFKAFYFKKGFEEAQNFPCFTELIIHVQFLKIYLFYQLMTWTMSR